MLKIKFSIFPLVCVVFFLVESYVMLQEPKGWLHQAVAEAPWRGVCFRKLLSPVLCSARGALSPSSPCCQPRLYRGPRGGSRRNVEATRFCRRGKAGDSTRLGNPTLMLALRREREGARVPLW